MFFCIWHHESIASENGTLIPMKTIFYPNNERGGADYGWLSTRYSFSFNTWYDESKMGFGKLRVLNDDVIAPGEGFGRHGHRDMEIITIVIRGSVAHQDSMGNAYVVHEGDVQVMSAGTGVMHSERNASPDEQLELFQIWIEPKELSIEPRYEQRHFNVKHITHNMVELVGKNSLAINQDASITYGSFSNDDEYVYNIKHQNNGVYIFVIEGSVDVAGQILGKRDAVGVESSKEIPIISRENSTFLIIEVPMK